MNTPSSALRDAPARPWKRSNKPIFWSMFGAGGMLSALIGPMLLFLTLLAIPFGFLLPAETLSYAHVLAFAQSWLGKLAILVVVTLFLFHGMHRFYHTVHDFGVHIGPGFKALCHGIAGALSLWCLFLLLRI